MLALALAAPAFGWPTVLSVIALGALWYGAETLLAVVAGWHVSARYPLICLMRDLLLPALFVGALEGNGFVWRGTEMQVERRHPRAMPALTELAPVARRGFRSLRARWL